jgi:F0F1-type ATP synthase membrane subunit c/vacuolar-type H+-ATPase subunit K
MRRIPERQRSLLPTLGIAALGGALAILLPGLVSGAARGLSLWDAAMRQPSVWSYQGLFFVGFVIAIVIPLRWGELPLVALAMVGIFPALTLVGAATGGAGPGLQQQLYLQAAWLIPSLLGLAVGSMIRALQRRTASRRAPGSDR